MSLGKDKQADNFPYKHLPATVATYFRDALACYRNGQQHGFAALCRLTAQAVFEDLGEQAKFGIYDQVEEVAQLANIDDQMYRDIRNILFDTESTSLYHPDGVDRETAAVLLETMKDILQQAYIRRALLREKLRMRRFFATQAELSDFDSEDPKVLPIKRSANQPTDK
jgi:hypothetical protein